MEFGCCLSHVDYDLLARCGYDNICLPAVEIAEMPEDALEQVKKKLLAGGLICTDTNLFCRPNIKMAGPDYPAGLSDYAKRLMERAHYLGIKRIGVGSSGSRNLPEGFDRTLAKDQLCQSFSTLIEHADRWGIEILIEAVNTRECNFITTTQEALEIIETLPAGKLGLVYDIYHAELMGEDLAWIEKAAPYLKLVHISQDINGNRCYLNADYMDRYREYTDALSAIGYNGAITLEASHGDLSAELPESLRILRTLCGRRQE